MSRLHLAVVAAGAFVAATLVGSAPAARLLHTDWSSPPEPYVTTYLGHPLHCLVTEDGSRAGRIGGLTCDFPRYWRARR